MLTARHWQAAFDFVRTGIRLTIILSLTSFALALVIGLLAALGILSIHKVIRNLSLLYVQVIRGIPIIVLLYFVAFVITPSVIDVPNGAGGALQTIGPLASLGNGLARIQIRQIDMIYRAIAGLTIAYGAFEAEVFRAGIESIERG